MLHYVVRRVLAMLLLLVMASFIIFSLLQIAPGSPLTVLTGGRPLPASTLHALTERYHLDDSFLAQYWYWLKNILNGDFGESIALQQPIKDLISSRAPITIELGLFASAIAITLGVVGGTVAAIRQGRFADTAISSTVVALAAVPAYLSGILLILIFGVWLGWLPVFGAGKAPADRFQHLILPALALGLSLCALVARVTRASMVRILDDEYIEAARARGFRESRVIGKHALRNALAPIITVSGLAAGYLITGAVLVEVVFGLNGLGALMIQGVTAKDFAVVQAVALVFTAVFLLITLVVDLLCFAVDPRTRTQEAA